MNEHCKKTPWKQLRCGVDEVLQLYTLDRGANIMAHDHARYSEPPQPQSGVCSKVVQGEGQTSARRLLLRRSDEQVKTLKRDGKRRPTCEERPALYDQFSLDPEVERWAAGIGVRRRPDG